jgi:hypothetical protein
MIVVIVDKRGAVSDELFNEVLARFLNDNPSFRLYDPSAVRNRMSRFEYKIRELSDIAFHRGILRGPCLEFFDRTLGVATSYMHLRICHGCIPSWRLASNIRATSPIATCGTVSFTMGNTRTPCSMVPPISFRLSALHAHLSTTVWSPARFPTARA